MKFLVVSINFFFSRFLSKHTSSRNSILTRHGSAILCQRKQIQAGRVVWIVEAIRGSWARKARAITSPSRCVARREGSASFNCVKYPVPTRVWGTPCEGRRIRKLEPIHALWRRTLTHDTANKAVSNARRGRRVFFGFDGRALKLAQIESMSSTCCSRITCHENYGTKGDEIFLDTEEFPRKLCALYFVPPRSNCFVELSELTSSEIFIARNTKNSQVLEIAGYL